MLSYEGKLILAPMVRVGTLPMRLLALDYGADLVFAPETVDKKLIGSTRIVNKNGTIDYIKDKSLVFRTHPSEKDRLILQLGTADPDLALAAALTVLPDISGIDLNCGCPKKFSLQAGMGAGLLRTPQKLLAILRRLVGGLPAGFPVTAKIRILQGDLEAGLEATLQLVREIAGTGVRALTVHARMPEERPRHPAHWQVFPMIAEAIAPLPLIANGDILGPEHIGRALAIPGVSSLMIARGAQWNVSIFRRQSLLPLRQVSKAYLERAASLAMPPSNVKYALLQMWMGAQELGTEPDAKEMVKRLQPAKTYEALAMALSITLESAPEEDVGLLLEDEE